MCVRLVPYDRTVVRVRFYRTIRSLSARQRLADLKVHDSQWGGTTRWTQRMVWGDFLKLIPQPGLKVTIRNQQN